MINVIMTDEIIKIGIDQRVEIEENQYRENGGRHRYGQNYRNDYRR